jgi:hypothetical protein
MLQTTVITLLGSLYLLFKSTFKLRRLGPGGCNESSTSTAMEPFHHLTSPHRSAAPVYVPTAGVAARINQPIRHQLRGRSTEVRLDGLYLRLPFLLCGSQAFVFGCLFLHHVQTTTSALAFD